MNQDININPDKAVQPDAAILHGMPLGLGLLSTRVNSALVTTPDGNRVWLKRDNKRFRKSMLEGYRLTRRIEKN